MKTRSLIIAAVAGTLTVGGVAAPAYADITPATISISGGSMDFIVPSASANLGSLVNTVAGGTISGQLGQITVNDARSASTGWIATVISTAFTPPAGPAIPASAVSYTAGTIGQVGIATYTANNPVDLTGVKPAVTATAITGTNSATWNPTITVAVPGGMAVNTYLASITHSLA